MDISCIIDPERVHKKDINNWNPISLDELIDDSKKMDKQTIYNTDFPFIYNSLNLILKENYGKELESLDYLAYDQFLNNLPTPFKKLFESDVIRNAVKFVLKLSGNVYQREIEKRYLGLKKARESILNFQKKNNTYYLDSLQTLNILEEKMEKLITEYSSQTDKIHNLKERRDELEAVIHYKRVGHLIGEPNTIIKETSLLDETLINLRKEYLHNESMLIDTEDYFTNNLTKEILSTDKSISDTSDVIKFYAHKRDEYSRLIVKFNELLTDKPVNLMLSIIQQKLTPNLIHYFEKEEKVPITIPESDEITKLRIKELLISHEDTKENPYHRITCKGMYPMDG